jgi:hypothetical protein
MTSFTKPSKRSGVMNFKNGLLKNGSSIGSGRALGNVKNGVIKDGSSLGAGKKIGSVSDILRKVKGLDDVDDATAVALYHFLVKDIF